MKKIQKEDIAAEISSNIAQSITCQSPVQYRQQQGLQGEIFHYYLYIFLQIFSLEETNFYVYNLLFTSKIYAYPAKKIILNWTCTYLSEALGEHCRKGRYVSFSRQLWRQQDDLLFKLALFWLIPGVRDNVSVFTNPCWHTFFQLKLANSKNYLPSFSWNRKNQSCCKVNSLKCCNY